MKQNKQNILENIAKNLSNCECKVILYNWWWTFIETKTKSMETNKKKNHNNVNVWWKFMTTIDEANKKWEHTHKLFLVIVN